MEGDRETYYSQFYGLLPQDESSFPPYLFNMIDLLKKADTEIDDLRMTYNTLSGEKEILEGKLQAAQKANSEIIREAEDAKKQEKVEDDATEGAVRTITEILDDVDSGNAELSF